MAKKVIPIHFESKDREVLRRLSKLDKASMADVVRRLVRTRAHEVIEEPKTRESSAVG